MTSENEENKINLKELRRNKKKIALENMNLKRATSPLVEMKRHRKEEFKERGTIGRSNLKTKKSDLKP